MYTARLIKGGLATSGAKLATCRNYRLSHVAPTRVNYSIK